MASIHKTFQIGEVLASADLNDGLNPATADHVPWAVAAGQASLALNNQVSNGVDITFPSNRFTKPPAVVVCPNDSGGGMQNLQFFATNVTPTGFRLTATSYNAAAVTVSSRPASWIAVQMDA